MYRCLRSVSISKIYFDVSTTRFVSTRAVCVSVLFCCKFYSVSTRQILGRQGLLHQAWKHFTHLIATRQGITSFSDDENEILLLSCEMGRGNLWQSWEYVLAVPNFFNIGWMKCIMKLFNIWDGVCA